MWKEGRKEGKKEGRKEGRRHEVMKFRLKSLFGEGG
jgi:hypothetical protein